MNPIFFVFLSTLVLGVNCVVVHLPNGAINGTTERTKEGRLFHKFLAIPYAKPPLHKLRFKAPEAADKWTGIRDATKPPPMCIQWTNNTDGTANVGQEDCLYLNVYIPHELLNSSGKAPVIVGIHGGGFQTGSSNNYTGDYFMERDVIFVSINYRLGVLGFLAVNDLPTVEINNDVLPGNYGLKDQALALKWVNQNIGIFGGDPTNVTLMGESAGSASVHFHMFSPLSKGLFQKAIMESGNAFSPWSHFPRNFSIKDDNLIPFQSYYRLDQLVALLFLYQSGCLVWGKLDCLQKKPAEDFTKPGGLQYTVFMQKIPIPFLPVIEKHVSERKAFLPNEPDASTYQTQVPWLTGINSGEGALIVPSLLRNGSYYAKFINANKQITLPLVNLYAFSANISDMPNITNAIVDFYFGSEDIGLETAHYAVDMITDSSFLYPLKKTVASAPDNQQYLYLYDHRGSISLADLRNITMDLGVCHGDEVPLLFRFKQYEAQRSIEDRRVSDTLLKYWINFAISGDPNRHSKEKLWQSAQTKDNKFEYLHIMSDGVVMENNLYHDRYDLWKSLPTGW